MGSSPSCSSHAHPIADNRVIVCRTFSKVYALAGLRLGYSVATPAISEKLRRYATQDNVNGVVLAAAVAALRVLLLLLLARPHRHHSQFQARLIRRRTGRHSRHDRGRSLHVLPHSPPRHRRTSALEPHAFHRNVPDLRKLNHQGDHRPTDWRFKALPELS